MDGMMKTGQHSYKSASCKLEYLQQLDSNQRGLLRVLTQLEAVKGSGDGTELMKRLCKQADEQGLSLMLNPQTTRLAEWYAREFGFWTLQEKPQLMLRSPNEVQPTRRLEYVDG